MLTGPFILVVLLTFVTVVAIPCNLSCIPALRFIDRMRPQARSPLLLLLTSIPWLLGGGVLISSVADIMFGACSAGQICLWNEDPYLVRGGRILLVSPLLGSLCVVGVRLAWQLTAARRAITALEKTSLHDADPTIRVMPSNTALAFAARGKVFVSSRMREALDEAQFRAVLLHEEAHLERSDGACQLVARVLSCVLIPPLRRRLLDALTLANEQSCDEAAGSVEGRLVTASAILAAERLNTPFTALLSPAFSQSFAAQRVRRLMAPQPQRWRAAHIYATAICGVLSVFLLGDLVYYLGMLLLFPGLA